MAVLEEPLDAVVAWNTSKWSRIRDKRPLECFEAWRRHPISLAEIKEHDLDLGERLVAVRLKHGVASTVELVLASLHLYNTLADAETKKKTINNIINFFSFYVVTENVQVIIGCDLNFKLDEVLEVLTAANRNALEQYGVRLDIMYPNEQQRVEAGAGLGTRPIDGFIVLSLKGVHIRERDGKVPCRLALTNLTLWNRLLDLKRTVAASHNPVFSEFNLISDIELVRQQCVRNNRSREELEGQVEALGQRVRELNELIQSLHERQQQMQVARPPQQQQQQQQPAVRPPQQQQQVQERPPQEQQQQQRRQVLAHAGARPQERAMPRGRARQVNIPADGDDSLMELGRSLFHFRLPRDLPRETKGSGGLGGFMNEAVRLLSPDVYSHNGYLATYGLPEVRNQTKKRQDWKPWRGRSENTTSFAGLSPSETLELLQRELSEEQRTNLRSNILNRLRELQQQQQQQAARPPPQPQQAVRPPPQQQQAARPPPQQQQAARPPPQQQQVARPPPQQQQAARPPPQQQPAVRPPSQQQQVDRPPQLQQRPPQQQQQQHQNGEEGEIEEGGQARRRRRTREEEPGVGESSRQVRHRSDRDATAAYNSLRSRILRHMEEIPGFSALEAEAKESLAKRCADNMARERQRKFQNSNYSGISEREIDTLAREYVRLHFESVDR
ncbi:hypothetical protein Ndes2526B_g01818 [Nannochloris sp. 'desiccata']